MQCMGRLPSVSFVGYGVAPWSGWNTHRLRRMTEAVFGDEYLTTSQRVFNISERKLSFSGDSFDIKDEAGKLGSD